MFDSDGDHGDVGRQNGEGHLEDGTSDDGDDDYGGSGDDGSEDRTKGCSFFSIKDYCLMMYIVCFFIQTASS